MTPAEPLAAIGTYIGSMQAEVPSTKFSASVRLPARSFSVLLTNPTCAWVQRLASDFIRRTNQTRRTPLPWKLRSGWLINCQPIFRLGLKRRVASRTCHLTTFGFFGQAKYGRWAIANVKR